MIDLKVLYALYIEKLNDSLSEYKSIISDSSKYKTQYLELINSYKADINKYCNVDYNTIVKANSLNVIAKLEFRKAYKNGKEVNFDIVKIYIEHYINHKTALERTLRLEKDIKGKIVSYTTYRHILLKFNNKVADKIVFENYYFSINPLFGAIGVVQVENNSKRPDWGKSNKNKKAILDRGGVPYIKEDAEKDPNYKGEEWLEYHPALDFYLQWHTKYTAKKYNPVLADYKYKPARGKLSIVTKLNEVKADRDAALALYTRTPNYKYNEQV